MDDIQDRLRTLVDYWIEHNREHEEEISEWAERASPLGEAISEALRMAAASMSQASSYLGNAQRALEEKPK